MNDVVVKEQTGIAVNANLTSHSGWELAQRVAKALAASTLVPTIYQGNVANCLVALEMAQRMGASPLMIMQHLYLVHGKPGWSAQFLIATFNQCGRFSAVKYRFIGQKGSDSWGCIAYATERSTGELIESSEVTIKMAKDQGWYGKKDSKWPVMPQQMLMYRSAAWLVRAYAPELSMGLQTRDELDDVGEAEYQQVTVASRDAGALSMIEADLLGSTGSVTGNPKEDEAQRLHDRLIAASTEDELNEAWELGVDLTSDPSFDSTSLARIYGKRLEELNQ